MEKVVKAAVVIIGNEILSGRTQDKNINYIALKLAEKGIRLVEVRVIPDQEDKIISTIYELKKDVQYIFTCGGIGPTHDDITSETMAKAFGVAWDFHPEAYAILERHYGKEEFTDARKKMAKIPVGADLILNPVSMAPGFSIHGVYVMAGVPRIMQAMIDSVVPNLAGGDTVLSRTVSTTLPESRVAEGLEGVQKQWPGVEIGSYPHFKIGSFGVSIVLRSTDQERLDRATEAVEKLIQKLQSE
jgi:molybdenum cofactor synthesis domain-containing protein